MAFQGAKEAKGGGERENGMGVRTCVRACALVRACKRVCVRVYTGRTPGSEEREQVRGHEPVICSQVRLVLLKISSRQLPHYNPYPQPSCCPAAGSRLAPAASASSLAPTGILG